MRRRFRDRLGLSSAAFVTTTLTACNLITGATALETREESPPFTTDGSVADGPSADVTVRPGEDGSRPVDPNADAKCPAESATTLIGGAAPLAQYFQLTPEMNNLAGGIASPALAPLTDFDVSFSYSMTYTSASSPAAGVAFFVIAAPAAALTCRPGPNLCTLGASAPGFAVILRTSKGAAGDPDVPYVAVVDAQSYPAMVPTNRINLESAKAVSLVSQQPPGAPPESSFHRMAIAVRSGRVTVSIDGAPILAAAPIPGWVAGRMSTWGIAASTGQGSGFACRTIVGQVAFDRCP